MFINWNYLLFSIAAVITGSSLTLVKAFSITASLINLQPSSRFSLEMVEATSDMVCSTSVGLSLWFRASSFRAFFRFVLSDIFSGSRHVTKARDPARFWTIKSAALKIL